MMNTTGALVDDYAHFLRHTYLQEINDMMAHSRTALAVHHDRMPSELALQILDLPEEHLEALRLAGIAVLKELHHDYATEIEHMFSVQIYHIPPKPLKKIGVADINKLICFEGKCIGVSDTEPLMISAYFRCDNCGNDHETSRQEDFTRPHKCSACGEYTHLVADRCKYVNCQVLKVQESAKGKNTSISCVVTNDNDIWAVAPGKNVRVTGVYKVVPWKDPKTKEVRWLKRIKVVTVEQAHADDVELSKADIENMKAYVDVPQFYEKMRDSIAPHIYGLEEFKEGVLLALASQGMRIPISVLAVGDPSTGKSEVMKWAVKVSHNGHETDMGDSSHVGLTVESRFDEDTKNRLAYVGLFGMADGGLAGIDEFDACRQEDVPRLKSVLASREINASKAGVHDRFDARCAIVVTCNSAFGRYETGTSILENMKFLGRSASAILSRFDLIFILRDIKDAEHDGHIADRLIGTYGKAEDPAVLYAKDTADFFGLETQRKYFAFISQHQPVPEIPANVMAEFKNLYLKSRKEDMNQLVDTRYFQTIIRLGKARARFLQRQVTIDDLQAVKAVLEKTRNHAAFDPRLQEVDANILSGVKTKAEVQREKNREEQFWECFDAACVEHEDGKTYAKHEDIAYYLMLRYSWKQEKAAQYIQKAEDAVKIYCPYGANKYNKVNQ